MNKHKYEKTHMTGEIHSTSLDLFKNWLMNELHKLDVLAASSFVSGRCIKM